MLLLLENVVVEQMKMTSLTTTCQIRDSLIFFFYAIIYDSSMLENGVIYFVTIKFQTNNTSAKQQKRLVTTFFISWGWRVLFCNLSGSLHSGQMELEIIFLSSLQKLQVTYFSYNLVLLIHMYNVYDIGIYQTFVH